MMFLGSDWVYCWWFIYKYTNITTKLNWKLFTKVFKRPSKESLVLDRQRVSKWKEKHKHFQSNGRKGV